jgi:hypothetical protein
MDAGNDTVDGWCGVVIRVTATRSTDSCRQREPVLHLRDFNAVGIADGAAMFWRHGGGGTNNNIAGVVITDRQQHQPRGGQHVGVDRAGKPEGNATYGILIAGEADNNVVGAPDLPNVLGANFLDGVAVIGAGVSGNVIRSNRIGTTLGGVEPVPNGTGVVVAGGAENTAIGRPGEGNLISGNISEGVWIQSLGTRNTRVQGNIIGSNAGGSLALQRWGGVLIGDSARASLAVLAR